ncbi:MAG: DUF2798 domain-containing protein [Eubacteriaceae bacterium]
MPKTKFQSVIFTLMMVLCMVYCMTCYTVAIGLGGITNQVFVIAIKEMWVEYVVVFVLIFFIITNIAKKLALRIITPGEDKPIYMILAMQSFTVCMIVPVITLFATFLHNGFTSEWLSSWIQTAILCFPMAYFTQVFFAGPLVRLIFRTLFKKQLVHTNIECRDRQ